MYKNKCIYRLVFIKIENVERESTNSKKERSLTS